MPMQVHFTLHRFPQIKNFECFYSSEILPYYKNFEATLKSDKYLSNVLFLGIFEAVACLLSKRASHLEVI